MSSGSDALNRRRMKGTGSSGRMGGGGRVQVTKTPAKNIVEMQQKRKVSGMMNASAKKTEQY